MAEIGTQTTTITVIAPVAKKEKKKKCMASYMSMSSIRKGRRRSRETRRRGIGSRRQSFNKEIESSETNRKPVTWSLISTSRLVKRLQLFTR